METRLGHGMLNLPLSKRGDIDRQIDAYKAQEQRAREKAARDARREFDEAKREALALIDKITDEQAAQFAKAAGCMVRSVKKRLRSRAGLNPTMVLRALRNGGVQ